ncbi:MAG TPA: AAA family ATPase [Dehalococcoidales bacterium]|nr:AAA family ATPase [Dehalococcoidales bacterium]
MNLNQKQTDALLKTLEYEQTHDPEDFSLGWRWSDVRVAPPTLNSLLLKGLLEEKFHSNSHRGLLLTDLGRQQATLLTEASEACEKHRDETVTLPSDIFEDIIGHEDVKELLTAALLADKPVHVLLAGPPALAKSLFLWDIERVCGKQALWLVGSATSKAGLWDVVAEREPQILLIDELDKMSAVDTAALLSLMEGGRLVRAKKGRALDATIAIRVVAATNRVARLSPELMSRFAMRTLRPYDAAQFHSVVEGVLVHREGSTPELAEEIARKLGGRCQDVRDAVRVARLSPQLGIDKTIRLLLS